jgi:hypothetical protein
MRNPLRWLPFLSLALTAIFTACSSSGASDEVSDESSEDADEVGDDDPEVVGDELGGAKGRWIPPSGGVAAPRDPAPAWKADKSTCRPQLPPGTERLRALIRQKFPGVTATYPYNCRHIRNNPKVTSAHAFGRAIDITVPTLNGKLDPNAVPDRNLGDPVAAYLVKNASKLGVQLIIWDRSSWSASAPNGKLYSSYKSLPHQDHIHVELNIAGSK